MLTIRETIVVEGRGDERAVREAVNADVIVTSGFGITAETLKRITFARNRNGVVIFTDPDHAGELIRRRINRHVPGCKNAYLSQADAEKGGDIGIENAAPSCIRNALKHAATFTDGIDPVFDAADLRAHGLSGSPDAARHRDELGRRLCIGYANARQLLHKLNHYGISRQQFLAALSDPNPPDSVRPAHPDPT